jgi:hypothetical protein
MKNSIVSVFCGALMLFFGLDAYANDVPAYVSTTAAAKQFTLAASGVTTPLVVSEKEYAGVIGALKNLGTDIGKVTGFQPEIKYTDKPNLKEAVIVGTIGKSPLVDQLIKSKKLDVKDIAGKWEAFVIQTIEAPFPGVEKALVVAGSDKRGTIYGIYDISEKIGVSPWYWWADVPAHKNNSLYVKNGRYIQDSPKVKYRGIFINDESPSFTGWCRAKFGGVNSKAYAHMFELLLRLKANFLWPAMWGNAFNEDDPLSPVVADEYGIVMGTSHHEPMMRAQKEYTKRQKDIGLWDYVTNKKNLDQFWFDGVTRNKNYDNVITIGMRGDGDVAMGKGNDQDNMKTLQDVVSGQRELIGKAYGKNPSEVPQLWAIFTEVQRYYDAGFSVPDDVLMLFCDNNWGYTRRIAPPKELNRKGGCGLYYHIDMNGGPWNDRWVNTTTIPKLREQFNLAYKGGLNDLWVVNVGDLKPKELPIDFIMRYAWNPDAYPADKIWDYTVSWATQNFGKEYAADIADIVSKYAKYNLLRKPEVQSTTVFSYVNHHEADRMVKLWRDVVAKAEAIGTKIAPDAKDAYYQLVLYPAKASAGVAEMYIDCGLNNLYSKQGRASANDYAKRAQALFDLDKKLSDYYNDFIANGKWKAMMSDIHIGYTKWSMPSENKLPALTEVTPFSQPTLGVAVEGSESAWPNADNQLKPALPVFDKLKAQSYYIDVFNRGTGAFDFQAKASKPWIKLSTASGRVEKDTRIVVDIDWNALPSGTAEGVVNIKKGDEVVSVAITAVKGKEPKVKETYFGNFTGEFSIPADQFNANIPGKNAKWIVLPDLGRDKACMGIYPVTAPGSTNVKEAPGLEYKIFIPQKGKTTVLIGVLPTQDIHPERGLSLTVAMNNDKPIVLDARKGLVDEFSEYTKANLAKSKVLKPLPTRDTDIRMIGVGQPRRNEVFDNIRWLDVKLDVQQAGIQTLKIIMADPEIVLERIIVNPDNEHPSYFGVPSIRHNY